MLAVRIQAIDGARTFTLPDSQPCRLLTILSKILGHADLSMLNKYVHPSQGDMDRAMEWYTRIQSMEHQALQDMLVEFEGSHASNQEWPGPLFGPPRGSKVAQIGRTRPKTEPRKAQAG
jgi:hypothetical protein